MTWQDLGYTQDLEQSRKDQGLGALLIGRVILEHKDRYVVKTPNHEYEAELLGNLRYSAASKRDLPVVGDWVAISEYDEGKALIHALLPRKSIIERKAVDKLGHTQIIAANIDCGIIVQSVNRDFSLNRLERYLTLCHAAKIEAIIVLSKVDLISDADLNELLTEVKQRFPRVPIIPISNETQTGIEQVKSQMTRGKTYCLLGSSGVGKSTLINILAGMELMATGEISQSIQRGKHITSNRELIVCENGIVIDNPGMREVGITDASEGLEMTFDEILSLAQDCKFRDCSHTDEKGCAILAALENEELNPEVYAHYLKLEKEQSYFESNALERKKKDKAFGKMIKGIKKQRKNNKY